MIENGKLKDVLKSTQGKSKCLEKYERCTIKDEAVFHNNLKIYNSSKNWMEKDYLQACIKSHGKRYQLQI